MQRGRYESMEYTSVRCTERLTAALEETDGDRGKTTAEIMEGRGAGDGTTIPFSLVQKLHEQLTANAQPESKFSSLRVCDIAATKPVT